MNERQQAIVNLVNQQRKAAVADLARRFQVSEVTIRQDLGSLEKEGFLRRFHGGAIPVDSDDVGKRLGVYFNEKLDIARRSAELVKQGETILLEGGSAVALLAKQLSDRRDLTVITPSLYIAHMLQSSSCDVLVLGGMMQRESESLVGQLTKLCIDQTHFSKAFIGVNGYTPETGFPSNDMMRADIAAHIIAKGAENIVLTDSSKFGQKHLTGLCRTAQIQRVVTDEAIPEAMRDDLQSRGIQVWASP